MTGDWALALRDPEANRWLDLSDWAFWLKHPEALAAQPSDGLVNEAQQFRRLGEELYVLEYDLTSVLFVFKIDYQVHYEGGEHLLLKKFSIVYHIDNFHVRVHKMIENVEALLALLGGVDPKRRPRKDEPSRRAQMEEALKAGGRHVTLRLLRQFRENDLMKRAVEARNTFVHLYRDEPAEWRSAMVTPVARIREYDRGPDALAEKLRRLTEPEHLDSYADEQANRLLETLRVIQMFRDGLWEVLLQDVAELLRTRPAETQERYQWLILHAQNRRDLADLAKNLRRQE
jgi:hypothetical protein